MTPDAKLRLEVYQEGQRAFNAGTPCPYHDWRLGTWTKGWKAAEAHRKTPTYPCVVGNQIVELTAAQRAAQEWRRMPAEQKIEILLERVERLERLVRELNPGADL